jgi:hypothetical protein
VDQCIDWTISTSSMSCPVGTKAVVRPPLPIEKRTASRTVLQEINKRHDVLSDGSSTSAGSGRTESDDNRDEWGLSSPLNWRIRNTFLDSPFIKPTLLQGFQCSRRAWSAPAGGREASEREEAASMPAKTPVSRADPAEFAMGRALTSPVENQPPVPRPLALAELVAPQPRSKGSALHYQGTCKPCAFFWKVVGCQYGSDCEFCHLCDADERKRRNKEKRMAMHAMQTGGRAQCAAPSRHSRGGRVGQRASVP